MITVVRTASIQDGKFDGALAWAVKVTKYMRDKFGANMQLARNIGGPTHQVHWVSVYPSLADLEKAVRQAETDEGYKALLAEARKELLFIASSIGDSIYESIA